MTTLTISSLASNGIMSTVACSEESVRRGTLEKIDTLVRGIVVQLTLRVGAYAQHAETKGKMGCDAAG
jgi:hypothetical protein